MRSRSVAIAVLLVGVAMAVGSLLVDTVGIGGVEGTFGWKQTVLLVVGVALAAVGVGMLVRPKVDEVVDDRHTTDDDQ